MSRPDFCCTIRPRVDFSITRLYDYVYGYMIEDRVECRTPTPGRKSTRIERWKFDLVRRAILRELPRNAEGVPFRELPSRVKRQIPKASLPQMGSVPWYTTVVKLELEVRGEIQRIADSAPQRLRRK